MDLGVCRISKLVKDDGAGDLLCDLLCAYDGVVHEDAGGQHDFSTELLEQRDSFC